LKNIGSDPVNLQDLYFGKGIEERFKSSNIVQPGGFIVLAEDSAMFHAKYGFAADYKFNGKLENNGERIWLNDICGSIIDSIMLNLQIGQHKLCSPHQEQKMFSVAL